MAATKKKNNKPQTSKPRKSTKAAEKAKAAQRAKIAARKKQSHRVAAALVCFLLALFVLLACVGVKALFINWLSIGIKGIIGYGFWLVPPTLIMSSYFILKYRDTRGNLRVLCTLLLSVVGGCIFHLFLASPRYALTWAGIQSLWSAGQSLHSGGAVSGLIAVALTGFFSKIGAAVILILILFVLIFVAFDIKITSIIKAVRESWENRYEYYDDEYEETDTKEKLPPAKVQARERPIQRRAYDAQLDEPTTVFEPSSEAVFPKSFLPKKEKKASVPVPQPILEPLPEEVSPIAPLAPLVAPLPVMETEETLIPKELSKEQKKDLIREQQEKVARDIANSLEQITGEYQYPPISLLKQGNPLPDGAEQNEIATIQQRLEETIQSFGINAAIVGAIRGPSVTRYEVELEQGVRLNKLTNLSDDIALSLGASAVRIAPVPGKISLVGIEVPNKQITPVWIREVLSSRNFIEHASKVSFSVGKDIGGNYIIGDAAKLPHLLIAGTTGSGKSVCTNSLIVSILYKATPEEVRLIMVDPKMVELGVYNGIPHLLIPVVTDPKKAAGALQWAVSEMMKRYRSFSEVGVRDLSSYNAYADKTEGVNSLPQIVVVIDELADLMLVAAKEVEESICRVAQMGRAAGMHLIIATQRPSADVITGLMKANIPSRIAFAVASSLESRIILDTQGAEKLVGKGDMLWFPLGSGKPLRVQGCLIGDDEVASVVEFVKTSGSAAYDEEVLQQIEENVEAQERGNRHPNASMGDPDDADELFPAAVEVILELKQASVSLLQRKLKLGYARAARLVDQMEDRGIVGPFEGSKPRQLLITREQWENQQENGRSTSRISAQSIPLKPLNILEESGNEQPLGGEDRAL
ncbi:MAG: DNA translocase FtsK [Evtepia sp.]